MFFRLSTVDTASPSHRQPHNPHHRMPLTLAGVSKIFLRLRRHSTPEPAETSVEPPSSSTSTPSIHPTDTVPPCTSSTPAPSPPSTPIRVQRHHPRTPSSPTSAIFSISPSSPKSPKCKIPQVESTSGGNPLSHPGLAENACLRREPIEQTDTYMCAGGVNVTTLLRATRGDLLDTASYLGANALIDEQWKCSIFGPKNRTKPTYKVQVSSAPQSPPPALVAARPFPITHITIPSYAQINYKANATRSTQPDPLKPVALDQVQGVPGLMTILRRNDD
ncbi:hypothetical protein AX17_002542 [Amanita inopinata Kibby_2008]|nr:hypothetical protein AX17_002542 [Amanita inopinata Kibby_2008]